MRVGLSASLVQGGRSGIGQYLVQLLGAMIQSCPGNEYIVFARQDDWPFFAFARDAVRLEPIAGWREVTPDDVRWHQFTLPRLARELRLDVLHVPTQRRMLWRKPCALVTTVHDPGPFRSPRSPQSRGSCPTTIFRALARRQDALIALGDAAALELALGCGLGRDRVTAVPIGVDPLRFNPRARRQATDTITLRHRLHPPFFLCVGRLEAATHNQLRLLEAFTRFKTRAPSPWQLVFVGGDGGRPGEVRAQVERSPYAADIRVVGYVPARELPEWYRAAGAVISIRRRDGFAHALLEAMASGTPVMAADSPHAREMCGDAAVYCDPDQVAAIEAQLTALASDDALRTRLAAAGPARAVAFSWQRAALATAEVYLRAQDQFDAAAQISAPVTDTASVA